MAHVLILGQTQSGKTSLATAMADQYRGKVNGVVVYDPIGSSTWTKSSAHVFSDPNDFMSHCRNSRRCVIFIDEYGLAAAKAKDRGVDLLPLATTIRHWGHRTHFIAQRYTMIPPTVRDQCSYLYAFRLSKKDSEFMAAEFVDDDLLEISDLERGQYIAKERHCPAKKRLLFRT